MGSTVILLFGKDRVELAPQVAAGRRVIMGESLGRLLR